MPAQTVIKIRRDTSTNWSSVNPTLAAGEIAFETDTNKIKVGDGSTVWASLDYASGAGTAAEITYDNVDADLIATTVKGALDELSNNKVDPADLTAVNTSADTTNFTGNLSGSDTTVQAALDTLDDLEISAGVTTSDTPPASPSNGDLWWESDTGILYIYYDNFWVEAVSGIVGPQGESGAVISDTEPADQDVLWVDTSSSATAESTLNNGTQGLTAVSNGTAGLSYQPISHNYIINGAFDIWQRGDSFLPADQFEYTADRFAQFGALGTVNITKKDFTEAELEVLGFGDAKHYLEFDATTGANFQGLITRLEDVRTLAGQEVTLSFYAKGTNPGTGSFNLYIDQKFGDGGSSTVRNLSTTRTVDGTWTRYTVTGTLGSMAGKTIEDNNFLEVVIRQTGTSSDPYTLDIWGVQLEAGSIATPFKRNANSIAGEKLACQRYYQQIDIVSGYRDTAIGFQVSTTSARAALFLPVKLRSSPSVSFTGALLFSDGVNYNANIITSGTSFTTANGGGDSILHCALSWIGGIGAQFRPGMIRAGETDVAIKISSEL